MAKPDNKNFKGKGPKKPQHGKPGKGKPQGNGAGFNEDALANLTSKLDQSLSNGDHKRKNPHNDDGAKQDQKRQKNAKGASPKGKGSGDAGKKGNLDLLAEIKELGGDEDDYDMINGVASEDEYDGKDEKKVDKKLRDELAALSKELGFAAYADATVAPDDEQENEEAPEEEEDDDDEDDESEEESEEDEIEDNPKTMKIGDMVFQPRADWHVAKLPKLPKAKNDASASGYGKAIYALKEHAKTLLEEDATRYNKSYFAKQSHKFLSTIMKSGTLGDKVSALTLAVQESPLHNIRAFDTLMGLAAKKSRQQALGAVGALVDLLGPGTLLPADRRLRTFQTQPGLLGVLSATSTHDWQPGQELPARLTQTHLIAWAYEDWLKETYFKLMQILENWCGDEIEYSRMKAIDFVYALLTAKPEQEANLLRLLVNKLGDRDRKIASRASYLLLQMQTSHPGMKPIIVRTIEQEVILHPSQDHRSKYYAINTLNQTILSAKEPQVAEALMRIYFDMFVVMLKTGKLGASLQTETVDSKATAEKEKAAKKKTAPTEKEQATEAADRLVSAVLSGVNRAAPFVGADHDIMEQYLNTLFKIAHSANFNTGIQALLLIQHMSLSRGIANDRFYRVLYESLLDPRLINTSKQSLYLNLLLRSLKNDLDVRRVKAFAKRMLQVAGLHQPPFVCGLFYVICHLRKTFPDLATLVTDPEESIFDDEAPEDRPVYDGKKRDPEYSNANRSCLWEMIPALSHYHPAVAVFAENLEKSGDDVMKPDLDSHSLIKFLDKFVYRNPKATDTGRGVSIMQPLRATKDTGDIWLGARATTAPTSVNTAEFKSKKANEVAAEDAFFHEYFANQTDKPKKESKPKAAAADGEDDGEEDEIWKALVNSNPDVDIDDADADVGFDDLDSEDMASDDDSEPALDLDSDMDSDDDDMDMEGGEGLEGVEFNDFSDDEDASDAGAKLNGEADDEELAEAPQEKTARQIENDKKKARRKALKAMPTFASADDYAELLGRDDEDM